MSVHTHKETIDHLVKSLTKGGHEDHIRIGFLLGHKFKEGECLIDGIFVPKQESTSHSTKITDAKSDIANLKERYDEGVLGIIQYNAGFGPYESETTREAKEEFSKSGLPGVLIVVNSIGHLGIYQ
jgi:hypothetical protein